MFFCYYCCVLLWCKPHPFHSCGQVRIFFESWDKMFANCKTTTFGFPLRHLDMMGILFIVSERSVVTMSQSRGNIYAVVLLHLRVELSKHSLKAVNEVVYDFYR
jgi:hypothetical protein